MKFIKQVFILFIFILLNSCVTKTPYKEPESNFKLAELAYRSDYFISKNCFYGYDFTKETNVDVSSAIQIKREENTNLSRYIFEDHKNNFDTIAVVFDKNKKPTKLTLTKFFKNSIEAASFFFLTWDVMKGEYPESQFKKNSKGRHSLYTLSLAQSERVWKKQYISYLEFIEELHFAPNEFKKAVSPCLSQISLSNVSYEGEKIPYKGGIISNIITVEYIAHTYRDYEKDKKKEIKNNLLGI